MAEALTEVTIALRLPTNPISDLLTQNPQSRIVLTPLGMNDDHPPRRFLISVHDVESDTSVVQQALGPLFDDLHRIDHTTKGIPCYKGHLRGDIHKRAQDKTASALDGFGEGLIHRPIVLSTDQAYLSFITTQTGPLEERLHTLIRELHREDIQARLIRLGPHRPAHSLGTYDEELTDKQADFLRTALTLGLYDTPRRITLESLASTFGISKAAAHNRMRNAERKVLRRYFGM
jgi:hypothetical protein